MTETERKLKDSGVGFNPKTDYVEYNSPFFSKNWRNNWFFDPFDMIENPVIKGGRDADGNPPRGSQWKFPWVK